MIIKIGKKAKIIFKTGSRFINEFGLWLEASVLDHTSMIIPEEIRNLYSNRQFSETIVIQDCYGNNLLVPQEEIEEIEYL
jgi:hypothetical protein